MVNIRSKRDSLTGFYTYVIHNPNTNQVLFNIVDGNLIDIMVKF